MLIVICTSDCVYIGFLSVEGHVNNWQRMGDMDTFYNKLFKQTIFVLQMVFQSVVQPTRIIESEARKMAGSGTMFCIF